MIFFNKRSTFVPYIRGREVTVVANYAALPDPTTVGDKFYWCENSQGTAWLPGSLGGTYYPRGLYYSNGTTWEYMETPIQATQAEVDAGVIDDRFVSPATLYNADQWNSVKIKLSTNSTQNADQNNLNLIEGTNMTITDDGSGNITFDAKDTKGVLSSIASGTNTYTTTITGVNAYNDSDAYLIRFTNGNTDTSTLNIYNGTSFLGAKTLYRNNDGAIIGGDIWDGAEMLCVYNSTLNGFQCIGTSPNSLFAYVVNADSVTINRGQPVYAFGSTGNRMSVKLANNQSDATSAQTYGLVYSTSIAANQKGIIIIQGVLDGLNLGGTWNDGDPVYLGNTAGGITKTKPSAPDHLVYLGVVERANAGNGIMYVRVQNGYELDELHNVRITGATNNQVLSYNSTANLWENRTLPTDILTAVGDGVIVSGTTNNTFSKALLVPANSYVLNDAPEVIVRVNRVGLAVASFITRLYWNTTPDIAGNPILISTLQTTGGGNRFNQFTRTLSIENVTGSTFSTGSTTPTDFGFVTPAQVSLAIDWTQNGYLVVSISATNAGDAQCCNLIKIRK